MPFVLALIVILGICAQWLAWRIGLPSILLLLTCGILAGPLLHWLHPDEVFGELLEPGVSFAVALILYEGGLTLKVSELPRVGGVVRNLVTVGAAATWCVTVLAARLIFDFEFALCALLGAILVVTGPTVIGPLLRTIRPTGDVAPILRWEGIVIDPLGALLTVLLYEFLYLGDVNPGMSVIQSIALTVLLGGGLGIAAAAILVVVLNRHWIPDYLENAVSLMLVLTVFVVSNHFQVESGLLAVTVMGFALANQKYADVAHIVEFKENLRVLLISSLFIVLAARLHIESLMDHASAGLLFVALLVLVARPFGVWLSSLGSTLTGRQRVFLAAMAPRGIVAAAISSIFALRLEERHIAHAEFIVPITFMTIITTVALYGLVTPSLARRLGVAESNPQGVLFVGASAWVRELASLLQREGFRVFVVDNNRESITTARLAGLPAYHGSILAEHAIEDISLGGLGRILAATPNEWVNILAVHRFFRIFGRAECYQLAAKKEDSLKKSHKYLHGRWLFHERMTYAKLAQLHAAGYRPKATPLTAEFDYDALRSHHENDVHPLFIVTDSNRLQVITAGQDAAPQPQQTVICLVKDEVAEGSIQ